MFDLCCFSLRVLVVVRYRRNRCCLDCVCCSCCVLLRFEQPLCLFAVGPVRTSARHNQQRVHVVLRRGNAVAVAGPRSATILCSKFDCVLSIFVYFGHNEVFLLVVGFDGLVVFWFVAMRRSCVLLQDNWNVFDCIVVIASVKSCVLC